MQPVMKVTPPAPPPRTSSDPNYGKAGETTAENNNVPVSVTYFSAASGAINGVERETIFADDHASSPSSDAANIVRQHLGTNPFNQSSSTNPFLDPEEPSTKESLDDLVEKKIQDLINANPFNAGGKFNTIGRSNPFSSNGGNNPFLDSSRNGKVAATSSGEDVNDSPDSSLEPEDHNEMESINKIVSTRLRCLTRYQVLNKSGQRYFGHSLLFNHLPHAAEFDGNQPSLVLPKTILETSW